jgi:hypothetical protein
VNPPGVVATIAPLRPPHLPHGATVALFAPHSVPFCEIARLVSIFY